MCRYQFRLETEKNLINITPRNRCTSGKLTTWPKGETCFFVLSLVNVVIALTLVRVAECQAQFCTRHTPVLLTQGRGQLVGKSTWRSTCMWYSAYLDTWNIILKTIGNRKGDCAWSCSRWQTQPDKIYKSQRTIQCHSLRILHWFVLCNFQIFSGCVCHLEQLHAQSPFLFPIAFSINLIPFFDICSVLAVFNPVVWVCAALLGTLRDRNGCCLGFGSWSLVFDCGMPRQISPFPPTPSQTEVSSTITMGETKHTSKTVVFFTIQRFPRISTSYKLAAPRYRLPCRLYRWASKLTFQRHGKIAQSCRNHKD